jgi:hypothetical protein
MGPQTRNVSSSSLDKDICLPTGLPGADVAGVQDGCWNCLCFIWLCLAAKPSQVGYGVDGLACFLHCPMVCGWQTWLQCFLISAILSCHAAVVGGALPGEGVVKP